MTEQVASFERPILVTGATGIVGAWLVRRLLDLGGEVVTFSATSSPAELFRSGDVKRVTVVRGDLENDALLERILVDYDVARSSTSGPRHRS